VLERMSAAGGGTGSFHVRGDVELQRASSTASSTY
jgi:hypothetical protein